LSIFKLLGDKGKEVYNDFYFTDKDGNQINNTKQNTTGLENEAEFECNGNMLQKVKFNKYFQEFTTYNENYELGLINDRILLEIAVA